MGDQNLHTQSMCLYIQRSLDLLLTQGRKGLTLSLVLSLHDWEEQKGELPYSSSPPPPPHTESRRLYTETKKLHLFALHLLAKVSMLYIFLLPCCSWDTVAMCSGTMNMFHIRACYVWHKVEMCSFTTDLKLLRRFPGVQTSLLHVFFVTWYPDVEAASLFSKPLSRDPRALDPRSCFLPGFSRNKAVVVQF